MMGRTIVRKTTMMENVVDAKDQDDNDSKGKKHRMKRTKENYARCKEGNGKNLKWNVNEKKRQKRNIQSA